ncbi:MAG: permease-like cell division protein FtsX [Rikenellaceae bacterium]
MARQIIRIYSGRIAATVALTFALFLCALSSYVILSGSHRLHDMIGEVRLSIEVSDTTKLDNYAIEKELKSIQGVSHIKFIDAKESQREFEGFLGHDLTQNIESVLFPNIYIVTLNSEAIVGDDAMTEMCERIEEQEWVASLHYESSIPEKVTQNIVQIQKFSLYVAIIVGLCALVIMYIVTRLSVGATFNCYPMEARRRLRKEAYRWAWIQGVLSGVSAAALLAFMVKIAEGVVHPMVLNWHRVPEIAAGAVVVSVVLSLLFTSIAVGLHKNIIKGTSKN